MSYVNQNHQNIEVIGWFFQNAFVMCIRGGQKNTKVKFQLAYKLIPSSWLSHFQKHKAHLWDPPGSASSGCHTAAKYTRDILKNAETEYFRF